MKQILALICWLCVIIPGSTGNAGQQTSREQVLSPYFHVEGVDSGVERFPLKSTDVQVSITGVIAEVTVKQSYANMGSQTINGKYIFPGSTKAAVHGMKMIIGERVIHAEIKEKEEARSTYETARRQGKNAALLEQQRPNVFSMEVANIMPGDTLEVELKYTELLVPEDGTYAFVYPTVVGPRYSSSTDGAAQQSKKWVANPYLVQGSKPQTAFNISVGLSTGMKLQQLTCPTHETAISYQDESRARVVLQDPAVFSGDRDYMLKYRLMDKQIASGLILEQGENENFFLLMAQPPDTVRREIIPPREYSFVIDISGSMDGFPLDTAKVLIKKLIGKLQPTDAFNVLLFAGGSQVLSPTPLPATQNNINRAIHLIEHSQGGGGTELLQAMKTAMSLPRKEGVARTMVVITDGYISAEKAVFANIQENLNNTNVFAFGIGSSVNRYLIEGIAKSGQGEPFVVLHPDQAEATVQRFHDYIAAPVLTDIGIQFNGIAAYDIEPVKIPDLFAQRPIIVFGKWRGKPEGSITLTGKNGAGEYLQTFNVSDQARAKNSQGLGYLWASSRVARLSDYSPNTADAKQKAEIVNLGLSYNLLTAFTSFVAVAEEIHNPEGDAQEVTQPLTLPKGVSNLAVGYGMQKVPEPGIVVMSLLILFGILLRVVQKKHALTSWSKRW